MHASTALCKSYLSGWETNTAEQAEPEPVDAGAVYAKVLSSDRAANYSAHNARK